MATLPTSTSADEDGNGKRRLVSLKIGGKVFALDEADIRAFQSEFLTKLVEEESPFQKPKDGIYVVSDDTVDPAWFSTFLHFSRYNDDSPLLLSTQEQKQAALSQADFWGIKERISSKIAVVDAMRYQSRYEGYNGGYEVRDLEAKVQESSKHHNERYDDGAGRIYCVDCDTRDIDSRFYAGRDGQPGCEYIDCRECGKTVFYDPHLDWCHKCSCCKRCQLSRCPADKRISCYHHREAPETTASLKQKLAETKRSFFN